MPNEPNSATGFDFSEAPGADILLDELFTSGEDGTPTTSTTPTQGQPEPAKPFLATATGTVYNSADDAVKGIEHKDALIAELRQKLSDQTGADPIRKSKEQQADEPVSYVANPKKYFEDIKNAKNEDELITVQKRFVDEQLMPYAGLIASVAKTRAVEEVASEVPEITTFLRSNEYRDTVDKYPLLKQSIQIAESNPQVAGDLGQLYRMAYSLHNGSNPVKTAPVQAVSVRPTVTSTPPPAPSVSEVTPASLATSEGRKALMREQEAKGVLGLRW